MSVRNLAVVLALVALSAGCVVSTGTVRPVDTRPVPPPPPPPGPAASVDVGLFYDSLAPYGAWTLEADLGWVWSPYGVPYGWRPYTDGRWVWTDYGWTWVSSWDWGWAPFHYGRWTYLRGRGWAWIPGREWAPAWVAWRSGGGYVGWAPLPPRAVWRAGVGLQFGGSIDSFWWSFVLEGRLVDARIGGYIVPGPRNVTLVRVTRDVTHYRFDRGHVVLHGVDPKGLRRAGGRPVTRYVVRDVDRVDATRRDRIRGDAVEMYRPEVREAGPGRTPPGRERGPASVTRPSEPERGAVRRAPATPPRREEDAAALERRIREQQQRLDREQRRESQRPPQGVSREELAKRHEQERKAMQEQAARERALLEARRKQEAKKAPEPPAKKKKESKEKEKEKKKDGGAARTRRDGGGGG